MTDRSASHARYAINKNSLAEINARTLVLVGASDHPIIRWSSGRLSEILPNSFFAVIEKGDHFLNLSSQDGFLRAVSEFLEI